MIHTGCCDLRTKFSTFCSKLIMIAGPIGPIWTIGLSSVQSEMTARIAVLLFTSFDLSKLTSKQTESR
jgi:hypothetical protein